MAKSMSDIATGFDDLVFKFGRVDAHEHTVIWDGGASVQEYPGWLTAEAACEAISDNAADKVGSGGATQIQIWGQGDDGLEITETITLNGDTGAVALANAYQIIYRVAVVDSEDASPLTGPNTGTITVRRTAGPINMAQILPTLGQTYMAIYRVPLNKYGQLIGVHGSVNATFGSLIEIKTRRDRVDERGWRGRMSFDTDFGPAQDLEATPILLYPGEDIIGVSTGSASGSQVSLNMQIQLRSLTDGSIS